MNAFDDNRLHHALDEVASPAQVPPLPYQAIVRDGARRRRRRRALGGLTACAAVAAAAVLATTAWSRPEAVSPTAPAATARPAPRPSPSAVDLPVRSAMPSGELNGSHWSIHVVDYREQGDGLYCEEWKIVVDGHENPDNNGSCSSDPNDRGGTLNAGVTIQRDPRVASSALLGVMFEGDVAPVGAVRLRVTWAGGSASAPVFLLPHDDRRYFFLAVPYAPGHPDAYYNARLAFLDARGRVVPSEMLQVGGQQYSVKPFVKQ
ncbi:hypothetical protein DN069_18160 [Streptacidiphilus pinicola]|uniref:Uncharacterized protein n=1 Tax=Streptacidiphilus pinicola TaxID=2219663 RepID=A0A2X0KAT8_9ACTN|nr:hypothetical protein [Streptacidiphilus pinicola]RAG84180.1 hypothetical protein DN069_18160 [Streptacidiphilus pinicola]